MRGLCGGVNNRDHACAISLEKIRHRALIADVHVIVPISLEPGLEALPVPGRAGLLPEKLAAHVVVDADDFQPLVGKEPRSLRADQTRRTRDYGNSHSPTSSPQYDFDLSTVFAQPG